MRQMAYKNLYVVGNGKQFHAGLIAGNIERKFPRIRETAEYMALEDRFFDYTQACDREEQRGWMAYYMNEALNMEQRARNLQARGKEHWNAAAGMLKDAALQFIVAYDMIAD